MEAHVNFLAFRIFQAAFSCLPESRTQSDLVLPRSIRAMFVPKNLKRHGGDSLQAFTELVSLKKRGMTSNISVLATDHSEPEENFLHIQDFFCQAVPRDRDEVVSEEISMCSKIGWELDILHSVPPAIAQSMKYPIKEDEAEEERKRVRASFYLIHDAYEELEAEDPNGWVWHHRLFHDWMHSIIVLADEGKLRDGSQTWSKTTRGMRQMLYDELEASNATDQLLIRVGQNLAAILRGEVTPLELMMEGDLLNQSYSDEGASKIRIAQHAGMLSELYAMKQPGAKVLEVGAGTGGGTSVVLEAFEARARKEGLVGSLLGHYTFTDISQGFFAAAREKFAAWDGIIEFKQLNIEEDPTTQVSNMSIKL